MPPAHDARPDPPAPGALPWVQVLRGAAALAVVFLHVTQQAGAFVGVPGLAPYAWLRPLPWDAGVDVFFVISGFVMLWSSARLFGRPGGVWRFLGRRIARVVPLYWLLTTALVAGALLRPAWLSEPWPGDWAYVAASYAFLPYRRPDGFIQPVFRLGWTLNYEMMFYAIFALALRWRPTVAIPGVIGVLVALAGCGRVLRPAWTPAAFWTDSIVLEFAFGVLLAAAALGGTRLPRAGRLLLAAVGLAGLAADATGVGIPRGVAWGLPSAALVGAAGLGGAGGAGGRLRRAAERLGDASYALYLVHPFPMRLLQLEWPAGGPLWIVGYIAAATLISVVLALALHRWVERKLTNVARRVLAPPTAKAAGRG
jgi:peptidoglycan/LPS O-acetylase OafA/YrhL